MIRILTTFALLWLTFSAYSQVPSFEGKAVKDQLHPTLQDQFKYYEVVDLDAVPISDFVKSQPGLMQFELSLGNFFQGVLEIYPHNLLAPNHIVVVKSEKGEKVETGFPNTTYRGQVFGIPDSEVRLTIHDSFFYGYIRMEEEVFFIEPARRFLPDAPETRMLWYRQSDVLDKPGEMTCAAVEADQMHDKIVPNNQEKIGQCLEVQIALAADGLMFNSYGSTANVINQMNGVLNNVQTNYDNEFGDDLIFVVVQHYVSTSPGADPWTASTNPNSILNSFTNWGPSGFSQTHDVATLWTDRNLDGSTIGIAWLSAVCFSDRYNVCQDFTTNAANLRVLQAHELGHNFSALHDASGSNTIMAPAVNSSNTWSAASIASIDNYVAGIDPPGGCLSTCVPPSPPVPAFTANLTQICQGSMVTIFDQSTGGATSWSWNFPGAIPATSTQQNPTVTYNNFGGYNVTLTVTNANGSASLTKPGYIIVSPGGTDFFFFEGFENGLNGWTLQNPDNGIGWMSATVGGTRQGPNAMMLDNFNYTATGQRDGLISPTLDFYGRDNIVLEIEHAYARFNASRRDSLIVYVSTNNGQTYPFRVFAATENGGGNFATRAETTSVFNPTTKDDWCFGADFGADCLSINLDQFAGLQNIRIKIENYTGHGNRMYVDNIRILSDCEVILPPVADFSGTPTSGCTPLAVQYSDQSENNPLAWIWTFEGGFPPTSTSPNPQVAYLTAGTYDVTLTVVNPAGSNTIIKQNYITVESAPIALFTYNLTDLTATFDNTSSPNSDSYLWNFGDGTTSNQFEPTHTFPGDGAYVVQLTVTNECGVGNYFNVITIVTPPVAAFSASPTDGCAPLSVQFTDESTANVTDWLWAFPGGTPSSSTEQNPVVVYNTPGVYEATLTVSNSEYSDDLTVTNYITVGEGPGAGFTYVINSDVATFTNTSSGADSYAWDFGDGNSSTEENPIHTYATGGNFLVTLIATNACGSDTSSVTLSINAAPAAGFTADQTSGCTPFEVQFTDQSSENVTGWSWSFPGGSPAASNLENPTVVYNNPGVYDVTLIVSNPVGNDTLVLEDYITVGEGPSAGFTQVVDLLAVDFTNNSVNADSFAWDFGDGNSSSEASPTHTYATDGVYTVILIASNECGSDTFEVVLTIVTPPAAGFTADQTVGCTPLTVQYTSQASDNTVSWTWIFEGGAPASSNAPDPQVVYNNPGTFDVTLIVSNPAGSDTLIWTDYITVGSAPVAGFTAATSDLTAAFTNTSTGAETYSWDFGDGNTSSEENPTHTYATDGSYTVVLTVTNACGESTFTQLVMVAIPPTAGFTADQTAGCAPLVVQFTDQSSENAATWNWVFQGGTPNTSTDQNPVVTYNNAGTFDVRLIVGNGAGSDTLLFPDYITVGEGPTAGFNASANNLTVNFTNTSAGADSYAWDFGDGNTSNQTDPTHTYGMDGVYTVTLTVTNECGTDVFTQEITVSTLPLAGFTSDLTAGCSPLTVQFANESTENAESFEWTFEGGIPASSTAENPVVIFDNPGEYDVTLTVSNAAGSNTLVLEDYITVLPDPVAGFGLAVNGATVQFTNSSLHADSYSWDFGDGATSNAENPEHTYAQDGSYTVVLTASNECGTSTFTEEVLIQTPPSAGFTSDVTEGCAPLTIQFTDASSDNADAWSWTFVGGNPATSSDPNPVVVYNTPGVYDVVLEVSNGAGSDLITLPGYITVNAGPTAGFTSVVQGLEATFTNNSANGDTYSWDFGDGNTSNEANPVHTYAGDGMYTVVLIVTNACGSDTFTQTLEVVTPPTAGFTASETEGCAPLTVQFQNQSSENAVSFLWSFPGGTPSSSTEENPVVVYNAPGIYDVTLEVSNAAGEDVQMVTGLVVVGDVPAAGYGFSVNGFEVSFTNSSQDADSYLWDFGDGTTSNEVSPLHVYTEDGIYTVIMTATNPCGSVSTQQLIVVAASAPIALFSADPTSGCGPLTVQFTNLSSENADSFLWSFPGGTPSSSAEENPVVVFDAPGLYDVSLTATNVNGSDTYTQNQLIEVLANPVAGFTFEIVNGATVEFTNASADAQTFEWSFGDGSFSADLNPAHTYTQVGTYTVTLTATGVCGTATFTETIEILFVIPNAAFTADIQEGCVPLEVQFTDQTSGNPTEWLWNFPGGNPATSAEQNPVVIFENPGEYNVTLQASNLAGTSFLTQNQFVVVNDVPQAGFGFDDLGNGQVSFMNTSAGADSYLWSFGDGNTSANANPMHTYQETGIYLVTLTATNECGSVDFSLEVSVMVNALSEQKWTGLLEVFPNPNNGQFTLVLEHPELVGQEVRICLTDVLGRAISCSDLTSDGNRLVWYFDQKQLAKAMYILQVRVEGQAAFRKVVVE